MSWANDRFLVPKGCDLVEVGAFPVAYGTSHVALVHRAQLHAGQVVLVAFLKQVQLLHYVYSINDVL